MLKSFNSLLIDKVQCVSSGNIFPEFFPAHSTCMTFFWADGLGKNFFLYAYALAGYFFKIPPPLRSKMISHSRCGSSRQKAIVTATNFQSISGNESCHQLAQHDDASFFKILRTPPLRIT